MSGLICDSFAGGGGASTGIEMALGRSPDIAINHDDAALRLHAVNHPRTRHLCSNIWTVDPRDLARRGEVALAWFSPDCKHFSKAKGSAPVSRNIRDLAWVVVNWAERVRPAVIFVENVEEFTGWGPVDVATNRPIADRAGETFRRWVGQLRRRGYAVQWRMLRACDYGAPTTRKRLFVIARCDGLPIVWPSPTHGGAADPRVLAGDLAPWRSAAEVIDWTIPCPSIFDTAEEVWEKHGVRAVRPLAEATLRRIARGVVRYVLEAGRPFVIYLQQGGGTRAAGDPLHTVTASTKDFNGIVVPTLVQTGYGERPGQAPRVPGLEKPLGTVVAAGGRHALVAAFLAQHNTGMVGHDARAPVSTLTAKGCHQQLVAAHLADPAAAGEHAPAVAAFLTKYYGQGEGCEPAAPLHTVTTRDRFGLVTVTIDGEPCAIADIGMRMLSPRELYRAQGFPESYVIDRDAEGRAFTRTEQTRMVGNSVCPPIAAALVRANCAGMVSAESLPSTRSGAAA